MSKFQPVNVIGIDELRQNEEGFLLIEALVALSIAAFVIASAYTVLAQKSAQQIGPAHPGLYQSLEIHQSELSSVGTILPRDSSDFEIQSQLNFLLIISHVSRSDVYLSAISLHRLH